VLHEDGDGVVAADLAVEPVLGEVQLVGAVGRRGEGAVRFLQVRASGRGRVRVTREHARLARRPPSSRSRRRLGVRRAR